MESTKSAKSTKSKTYFEKVPLDVLKQTLYLTPPRDLDVICKSKIRFTRLCDDPNFVKSYLEKQGYDLDKMDEDTILDLVVNSGSEYLLRYFMENYEIEYSNYLWRAFQAKNKNLIHLILDHIDSDTEAYIDSTTEDILAAIVVFYLKRKNDKDYELARKILDEFHPYIQKSPYLATGDIIKLIDYLYREGKEDLLLEVFGKFDFSFSDDIIEGWITAAKRLKWHDVVDFIESNMEQIGAFEEYEDQYY